jgi:hypothetical protein
MKITSPPQDRPIPILDRPTPGWFSLGVMRKQARKWDWVALMVDVDPDDLKNCTCDFPARFYVHPEEYRPKGRTVRQCLLLIPGKHRNYEAAWEAFCDLIETRH